MDRFGEPSRDIDEGSLLFDPHGYVEEGEEGDPGRSWARRPAIWGLIATTIFAVALYAFQVGLAPDRPDTSEAVPPVLPDPPPDTLVPTETSLMAIPADTVEGRIESSVRVAVRALAAGGGPLADTVISFVVDSGGGTLAEADVRTTRDGIAVNFLRLPEAPGATRVEASLAGSDIQPVDIVATALPNPPARISIVEGNGQEAEVGALLPQRLYVEVFDDRGNPVPRAVVTFRVGSGDGQMAPAQTRTDSVGRASALWRLGMAEGDQTLVATASGVGRDVTFRATALPLRTLEIDNRGRAETAPVTVVRSRLTVGAGHACSLGGRDLQCWGADDRGQSRPGGALDLVAIAAGASHTCGLSSIGVASCWGANEEGQLGDGTREDRDTPTRVRTDLRFATLAAGEKHTCGLSGGGVPFCWGENLSGQVGDGTRNDQTVPRTVGEGLGFQEITAGSSHTCGRTSSNNTFCWGANNRGQLGDGSAGLDRLTPTLVQGAVSGLVAGHEHTCGIAGDQVLCWGANNFGQLGNGTTEDLSTPGPVTGLPARPAELAAGSLHTCARSTDGRVFCWGQNFAGQLGDGTTQNRTTPVAVAGDLRFTELEAGGAETCALSSDGQRYCWGLNQSGQLGDGTRVNRSTPTRVGG